MARAPEVLAILYTREEATDEIDRRMRDRDGRPALVRRLWILDEPSGFVGCLR
ncbi:hypothetical protein [Bradyrhizobium sp. BRP56]|uniref:hypothetical protein n=1 Tax=Bradyrhizobium sp. BRP56 TaxID=2793819 RepID=UPI001CD4ADCC|nr:hypothetical protein [Bradyrhizobium sp. BRP56]